MNGKQNGFTLIEFIVVMTLFTTMFGLSWLNLSTLPSKTAKITSIQTLTADIRAQQTQAMSGDADRDYGVYFDTAAYVLFRGSAYDPDDATNFRVDLTDSNLSFTNILFPDRVLVFAKGSGEAKNYVVGQDSIEVFNGLTNQTEPIRINKYGATY